jgi:hypothetical protein
MVEDFGAVGNLAPQTENSGEMWYGVLFVCCALAPCAPPRLDVLFMVGS